MRSRCCFIVILVVFGLSSTALWARPYFLVLSGGGDPSNNHHSQYLQTKTLADALRRRFGKRAVTVLFGAGNDGARSPILADVHAETRVPSGASVDHMIRGDIKGNRPGSKAEVHAYFESEAPRFNAEDTFFLFVSDHGLPNSKTDDYDDNCIHLWGYDGKSGDRAPSEEQCLSRSELQGLLQEHVRGRTVFAMSQCYSGGFHQMAVDDSGHYPTLRGDVCGFTSVTEDIPASGCTEDVEKDRYQGYERYFTEQLTGRDVVTGRRLRDGRDESVLEAHEAAVLKDPTIDVPMSTSDAYLQSWYYKIWDATFKPRFDAVTAGGVRRIVEDVVDSHWESNSLLGMADELSPLVAKRLAAYLKIRDAMARLHPELAAVFERGRDADLDREVRKLESRIVAIDRTYGDVAERYWRLRWRVVFPQWRRAVRDGRVAALTKEESAEFETSFLGEREQDYAGDPMTDRGIEQTALLRLSEWSLTDPDKAARLSEYMSEREAKIFAWALSTGKPSLINAAVAMRGFKNRMDGEELSTEYLERALAHIRRVQERRQQLAAAVAIGAMKDSLAISELKKLEACEETAF